LLLRVRIFVDICLELNTLDFQSIIVPTGPPASKETYEQLQPKYVAMTMPEACVTGNPIDQ